MFRTFRFVHIVWLSILKKTIEKVDKRAVEVAISTDELVTRDLTEYY